MTDKFCRDCGKRFQTASGLPDTCWECWAKANPLPEDTGGSYGSNPIAGESARRLAAMEKIANSLARTAAVQERSWALVEKLMPAMEQMLAKMQKDAEKREDR